MRDIYALILGGSSYVGQHLWTTLGTDKAIPAYYSQPIHGGVYFDSLSMNLADIIEMPEAISHAVILLGDTNPETCAADITKSRALNVDSIKRILEYLKSWRIKPVFISSEFVFDGTKGNYVESDPVNPILVYGRQKVEIERYLQDRFDEFIVVRLAKVFGAQRGDGTLFMNWLNDIEQCRIIYCARDQVFSPIYIDDAVAAIIRLIESDCNGTFHLSGHRPFSRLGLLNILLAYVGEQTEVIPCSIHDFGLAEKRPLNVSMRPDKLVRITGLQIGDVERHCKNIARA